MKNNMEIIYLCEIKYTKSHPRIEHLGLIFKIAKLKKFTKKTCSTNKSNILRKK